MQFLRLLIRECKIHIALAVPLLHLPFSQQRETVNSLLSQYFSFWPPVSNDSPIQNRRESHSFRRLFVVACRQLIMHFSWHFMAFIVNYACTQNSLTKKNCLTNGIQAFSVQGEKFHSESIWRMEEKVLSPFIKKIKPFWAILLVF